MVLLNKNKFIKKMNFIYIFKYDRKYYGGTKFLHERIRKLCITFKK